MQCLRIWLSLLFGVLFGWRGAMAESEALDPVTVQLKWRHQFQFAGYYAALEKGFYRDAGLDVQLVEATWDTDPVATVVAGRAEFGVTGPDLLLRRSEGQPVVALGVIFQHSAQVLLGRMDAGIDNVHDLVGKQIMMERPAAELIAYLQREGITKDRLRLVPHEHTPEALIQRRVEAISAYEGDEAFLLEEAGIRYRTFSPREGGIDFYGDLFFTSEEQLARHPERVRAFYEATLRGWRYAFDHEDEVIAMILDRYSTRHSRAHLKFEAAHMRRLVMPDIVEPGYMNPGRWAHIAHVYAEVGMMDPDFNLHGFIYEMQPPPPDLRRLHMAIAIALAVIVVTLIIALSFHRINRRLRLAVAGHVQAEEALRIEEEKYRVLTESMRDVVWNMDFETLRFLYVSPSVQRLRGYTVEEVIAQSMDTAMVPEQYAELKSTIHAQVEEARKRGFPSDLFYVNEVEQPCKDGSTVWTEVITNCYLNPASGRVEVRGVTRDITERRRTARQREELEVQRHKLEKAESLNRMAGAIAHHFNNQMQAVLGNVELAMMPLANGTNAPGDLEELLGEASRAAHRASELSTLMLNYLGHVTGRRTRTDLVSACRRILDAVRPGLPRGVTLIDNLPDHDLMLDADHHHLERAITSLVTNAVEASAACPNGAKPIVVKAEKVPGSSIATSQRYPIDFMSGTHEYISIQVVDSGCGIPPADFDKLFEPFFSTKHTGRGLGLPVVLGIARAYDGVITVDSALGSGSAFRLYLAC